jgi:pectinesterase
VGGTTGTGGTTGPGDSLCPPGITRSITVAKDGSGQFNTVQAAVNSITSGSSARIRIDIKAGTYTEKLTIASRTNLCMVGAGATTTILAYGDSNASAGGTAVSASVHISADDFSAANLTFQNTFGSGSQAVALRTTGDRQQFLNCRFVGYQDTLYTHNGSQYFRNCYVQGNTDFVFGGATAVLQNCEVRNVESGSAVAAPNTDAGIAYGIVFLGGKFTAASGVKSALGRPWGAAGFAAYLNVDLGSHISAAGFVAMSDNQPQNARFHEYGSTGSGANAASRSSYQLTAAQAANYTLTKIFGSWTPTYSQ